MTYVLARLRRHWPEYLMEAWGLGTFMVMAGLVATLLEWPGSPVHQALPDPFFRRFLMGAAMGLTAVGIIYSPWGKQSGAHINPAVTLAFLRIGKVHPIDAGWYILAQFAGGTLGVLMVWAALGAAFAEPPVDMVNTVPGAAGIGIAYLTEALMSYGLMFVVLALLPSARLQTKIGLAAGFLVMAYITFLAPLSGMSINPARTFASAAPEGVFNFLWLYFTAPVIGMLLAVETHARLRRTLFVPTAKLCPNKDYRCIFTGFDPDAERPGDPKPVTEG